ncbi:MAG: hypothetical protein Kow0022_05000 [Phycisphaerales bacterium]
MYASGSWREQSVEVDGRTYPVGVWVPEGWAGPGRGLVFLHGAGECGSDGQRQLTVGLPPAVVAEPQRWPFVVICPQKPTVGSAWEDHAEAVFAAMAWAEQAGLVDRDRWALTGLSQGGHGTMVIGSDAHARFRAAAPVCGYIAPRRRGVGSSADDPRVQQIADGLATMPVWIFHGGRDNVVSPEESRLLHTLLTQRGADVQLTIFPEDGHNSWDSAYLRTTLNQWLIEHTRKPGLLGGIFH